MVIQRDDYLNALIQKKDNGRVKIITGIRRCGKSYLLFHLYKDHLMANGVPADQIIELQLDDIENIRYRNPFHLHAYVKERITDPDRRYYVFIDEIQMCGAVSNPYMPDSAEAVTFIDAVLGLIKIHNADIYVTGSNSKMLSREVLTQFRDRGDEIRVFPLSFAEFRAAYERMPSGFTFPMSFPLSVPVSPVQHAWRDYCTYGGMPYLLSLKTPEEKSRYLKDLFEETYIRDIIERNDIRNDQAALEILLDFVSSAIGSLTNPSKLERRFQSEQKVKLSHSTISRYLDFFREAYVLDWAKRYDIKGSAYFDTPLKYYFSDIGLRNARLNFRQVEETHIMENILYNDLVRRGYNVDVGVVGYSRRQADAKGAVKKIRVQLEVDFVVNQGSRRYYIQSALHVDDPQKREQEIQSLNRIRDSFKKIVVIKDDIVPRQDENGILYMGIERFLLDENALTG